MSAERSLELAANGIDASGLGVSMTSPTPAGQQAGLDNSGLPLAWESQPYVGPSLAAEGSTPVGDSSLQGRQPAALSELERRPQGVIANSGQGGGPSLPQAATDAASPRAVQDGHLAGEPNGGGQTLAEPIMVTVGDRRVKLSSEKDPSSLYSLCRKWVRNKPTDDQELGFSPSVPSVLPKPLPAERFAQLQDAGQLQEDGEDNKGPQQKNIDASDLTAKDLLAAHIQDFKDVRKRKRADWRQRLQRYKPRLCLIFPPGIAAVTSKPD